MEVFIILISSIWGILCIILFFNIWGMTNNVRRLRQHFVEKDNATVFLLSGNKEKYADILIWELCSRIINIVRDGKFTILQKKEFIEKVISQTKEKLNLLGMSDRLPQHLNSLDELMIYFHAMTGRPLI